MAKKLTDKEIERRFRQDQQDPQTHCHKGHRHSVGYPCEKCQAAEKPPKHMVCSYQCAHDGDCAYNPYLKDDDA
jgi:hypothetical protein